MLIGLYGLQCELFDVTRRSIEALCKHAGHPVTASSPSNAADFAAARANARTQPQLVIGHTPAPDLVQQLRQAGAPFFVPLIDVAEACRAAGRLRKCDATQAVRHTSLSLAMLHDLALDAAACIVTEHAVTLPLNDFLAAIAHRVGLNIDEGESEKIARQLAPGFDTGPMPRLSDILPATPDDNEESRTAGKLGRYALSGYSDLANGEAATRFDWPIAVFMGSRPHGAYLNGPVSLVGGRRCFLFGPFIRIPAGRWRVSLGFDVRDNVSGNELKIDAYTDRVIWEGRSRLPQSGSFRCAFEVDVTDASLPLQIRLFNEEAAIEGEMDLHGVAVEKLPPDPASTMEGERAPPMEPAG